MKLKGLATVNATSGQVTAKSNQLVVAAATEVLITFSAKTSFKDKLFREHLPQP